MLRKSISLQLEVFRLYLVRYDGKGERVAPEDISLAHRMISQLHETASKSVELFVDMRSAEGRHGINMFKYIRKNYAPKGGIIGRPKG